MEDYTIKNGKKLRYGYTTGSCAAAAAKAAAVMLLGGEIVQQVTLTTPKGITLDLEVLEITREMEAVTCAILKDGGDDPDVTTGLLIYAKVIKAQEKDIRIDGGNGVGRVTKKGLDQPVGNAAINSVPRKMIESEVKTIMARYGYDGGLKVEISVPGGAETALKTFNPRLGIVGGISILGTSGIVEPMSEAALIKTIEAEMNMQAAEGAEYIMVTPGNYGADYIKSTIKEVWDRNIKCSNYIGETIDLAVAKNFKGILFAAHIGKFAKVAGGIMNTHSRNSDARMEILASCAVHAGITMAGVRRILEAVTTDEALEIMQEEQVLDQAMDIMLDRIHYYLNKRSCGAVRIGAIVFSNQYGTLGQTEDAEYLIKILKGK